VSTLLVIAFFFLRPHGYAVGNLDRAFRFLHLFMAMPWVAVCIWFIGFRLAMAMPWVDSDPVFRFLSVVFAINV
jgi:hypothetical protein